MIPQWELCRCTAKETWGLASCTPDTAPAISGRTVLHRHALLSATRNKTVAFISLSQGVLRGDVCWAWKKGQLFCFCSCRQCLIHMMSAFGVMNLSLPNCCCLQKGGLQQGDELPPSHQLNDTVSIHCSNPSSSVTTAVPVDVYFWQLSLKDNKETRTEVVLGHLSDLLGAQAWKLSFLHRQSSRITFKLWKWVPYRNTRNKTFIVISPKTVIFRSGTAPAQYTETHSINQNCFSFQAVYGTSPTELYQ